MVAPFDSQVLDLSVARLGDAQPIESQNADERVAARSVRSRGVDQAPQFGLVQARRYRFVRDSRTTNVRDGGASDDLFLDRAPVVPAESRQTTCNRRAAKSTSLGEVERVEVNVSALGVKPVDSMRAAECRPVREVAGIGGSGGTGVTGQERERDPVGSPFARRGEVGARSCYQLGPCHDYIITVIM